MTTPQLYRISGLGLLIGAVVFTAHILLRSAITAGVDPSIVAKQGPWLAIQSLGVLGSILVLLGLPAIYARMASLMGVLGLVAAVLISVAWIFLAVFLSLYSLLVMPWLADRAPSLVAASASLPENLVVAFLIGLLAWSTGCVLLAVPFIRRQLRPRWAGYVLIASAVWMVVGDVLIAPSGPAANLAINVISNLGPVLLLVPLGHLGFSMWSERAPHPQSLLDATVRKEA